VLASAAGLLVYEFDLDRDGVDLGLRFPGRLSDAASPGIEPPDREGALDAAAGLARLTTTVQVFVVVARIESLPQSEHGRASTRLTDPWRCGTHGVSEHKFG